MATITSLFADFATEQRGWFVLIFVLPISVCFDIYFSVRAWLVMKFYSAPELHEQKVSKIQAEIKEFHRINDAKLASGEIARKPKLCTARGGWQSMSPSLRPYKNQAKGISINLYDILEFDEERRVIRVEPMVNMGQISHYLIPKGYAIPVLPEMDDLTVGGLLMGVGIETSSHKYGLFNDTVVACELVLADGNKITCSPTENADLFDAVPWSYGTLGFLTSVSIRVIEIQPYIKINYLPVKSAAESEKLFQKCVLQKKENVQEKNMGHGNTPGTNEELHKVYFEKSADQFEYDFVEMLMYSRNTAVVMPATFASKEEAENSGKINKIGLWFKPWFYKHVEKHLEKGENVVEYLPLRDYYHRHTKSIFWELEEIIPFGNNPVVRYLLGWALPPKVSFLKMTQTAKIKEIYEKSHVIQDMLVPFSKMGKSLDVFESHYGIYPLWICPYRHYDYSKVSTSKEHRNFLRKPGNLEKGQAYEMYVDLGAYGIPRAVKEKKPFDIVKVSREVEEFVWSVNGFQMLYATSYLTKEEFRRMFDHKFYDAMKEKYDVGHDFPQIFDKVCKNAVKIWEKEYSVKDN